LAGLDGYGQMRILLDELFPLRPTCRGVFEDELFHDLALLVHDDHMVVILGPVKAGIMSNVFPT
jgi:hypothetical protein